MDKFNKIFAGLGIGFTLCLMVLMSNVSATTYLYDMDDPAGPDTEPGYTHVNATTTYGSYDGVVYGWKAGGDITGNIERVSGTNLSKDYVYGAGAGAYESYYEFIHDLPNAYYNVSILTGDTSNPQNEWYAITDDKNVSSGNNTAVRWFYINETQVSDGTLNINGTNIGLSGNWLRFNAIEIENVTAESDTSAPIQTLINISGDASSPYNISSMQLEIYFNTDENAECRGSFDYSSDFQDYFLNCSGTGTEHLCFDNSHNDLDINYYVNCIDSNDNNETYNYTYSANFNRFTNSTYDYYCYLDNAIEDTVIRRSYTGDDPGRIAIILHGRGDSSANAITYNMATNFMDRRYNVFAPDLMPYNNASNWYDQDAVMCAEALRDYFYREYNDSWVVITGVSMGAGGSLDIAGEYPGLYNGTGGRCGITNYTLFYDNHYPDVYGNEVKDQFGGTPSEIPGVYNLKSATNNAISKYGNMRIGICHADSDTTIEPIHGQNLNTTLNGTTEIIYYEGSGGHCACSSDLLVSFIDQQDAEPSPPSNITRFDFDNSSLNTTANYTSIYLTQYTEGLGYGWLNSSKMLSIDRTNDDPDAESLGVDYNYCTICNDNPSEYTIFRVNITPGYYDIAILYGDEIYPQYDMYVMLDDGSNNSLPDCPDNIGSPASSNTGNEPCWGYVNETLVNDGVMDLNFSATTTHLRVNAIEIFQINTTELAEEPPINITPGPPANTTITFILEPSELAVNSRSTCLNSDWLQTESFVRNCIGEEGNYTPNCYWNNQSTLYYCANGCYGNVTEYGDSCSPPDYFIYLLAFVILIVGLAGISWLYGRGR